MENKSLLQLHTEVVCAEAIHTVARREYMDTGNGYLQFIAGRGAYERAADNYKRACIRTWEARHEAADRAHEVD